jgi:hypothetical protein
VSCREFGLRREISGFSHQGPRILPRVSAGRVSISQIWVRKISETGCAFAKTGSNSRRSRPQIGCSKLDAKFPKLETTWRAARSGLQRHRLTYKMADAPRAGCRLPASWARSNVSYVRLNPARRSAPTTSSATGRTASSLWCVKRPRRKGVDVVFEHTGADTFNGSLLCLKRGGRGAYGDVQPDAALPAAIPDHRLVRRLDAQHPRRPRWRAACCRSSTPRSSSPISSAASPGSRVEVESVFRDRAVHGYPENRRVFRILRSM